MSQIGSEKRRGVGESGRSGGRGGRGGGEGEGSRVDEVNGGEVLLLLEEGG